MNIKWRGMRWLIAELLDCWLFYFLIYDLYCRIILSPQAMGRGTPSFGKRHTKTHTLCRRCGRMSFHKQKGTCAACGYPAARLRKCTSFLIKTDGHSKFKIVKVPELAEWDILKLSPESTRIRLKAEIDFVCL